MSIAVQLMAVFGGLSIATLSVLGFVFLIEGEGTGPRGPAGPAGPPGPAGDAAICSCKRKPRRKK